METEDIRCDLTYMVKLEPEPFRVLERRRGIAIEGQRRAGEDIEAQDRELVGLITAALG